MWWGVPAPVYVEGWGALIPEGGVVPHRQGTTVLPTRHGVGHWPWYQALGSALGAVCPSCLVKHGMQVTPVMPP